MKHILIRGPRRVGKSTLTQRLLAELNPDYGGFITLKGIEDPEQPASVYIHPATQPAEERVRTLENCPGLCLKGKVVEKRPEVFDTLGVEYLRSAKGKQLILMDELGFLERDALAFQQEVLRCLDGDTLVLATVKDKEVPFLETLCAHPKAQVYTITKENRDTLYEELLPLLKDYLGK